MFPNFLLFLQQRFHIQDITLDWVAVFEILFIAVVVLYFYSKFIKNTQSEKLVKGIIFLFCFWFIGDVFLFAGLNILGMFIKMLVTLVSLSLIVIFQPELRRLLGFLGQGSIVAKMFAPKKTKHSSAEMLKEIIESVKYLSKTHTGALIVFQKNLNPSMFFDVGTKINADISTELILTIFHINTPLHDGAVIINENRIASAGVLLPLTEDPKLSWKYGTRHRAAIGMSEISDAACLVVSEETGDVSMALDGTLKKYEDLVTLKEDLENILCIKPAGDADKKTIFKINNLITIKKVNKKKSKKTVS